MDPNFNPGSSMFSFYLFMMNIFYNEYIINNIRTYESILIYEVLVQ